MAGSAVWSTQVMTEAIPWAVGYFACSVAAFWLFIQDWRRDFDVNYGEALFFALICLLGPIALLTAGAGIFCQWVAGKIPKRTIWRRRP